MDGEALADGGEGAGEDGDLGNDAADGQGFAPGGEEGGAQFGLIEAAGDETREDREGAEFVHGLRDFGAGGDDGGEGRDAEQMGDFDGGLDPIAVTATGTPSRRPTSSAASPSGYIT